ncbi:YdeI family protein [Dyadobacter sp. CY326]|uniref:YdeI/OmpD-associated family protein n=1 Tax=Dyadobacter sp. CY326 TaxID=2907300 RepID=UPI001F3B8EE7|nr:YdeI/OmpD-associated family protein [Dyadobacter sp. CY326]MCE7067132.1 YdeI/OmpD-associated family protein [Dyadobacter sp. CY326]
MNFDIEPLFFAKQSDFREWLEKNHDKETELFVGFYKVASGKPSMTWSQSVDEALCFGWIDAVRKSIDGESYMIRFTRRKSTSIWSNVNIKKIEELTAKGLMHPAGIEAFRHRTESKSGIYAFEKDEVSLPKEFEDEFKASQRAWAWFENMPASYRKHAIHWIMDAKQEVTRKSRLEELIRDRETGIKLKRYRY